MVADIHRLVSGRVIRPAGPPVRGQALEPDPAVGLPGQSRRERSGISAKQARTDGAGGEPSEPV